MSSHFSQAVAAFCTSTIECLEPPSSSTLLRNLAVACSCSHPVAAQLSILDTSITTFQTRTSQIKILDWIRICCSSGCRFFDRGAAVETLIRPCRWRTCCGLTLFLCGVGSDHSTGTSHCNCHWHRH